MSTSIRMTLEGGKITEVNIDGDTIRLTEPLPAEQHDEIEAHVNFVLERLRRDDLATALRRSRTERTAQTESRPEWTLDAFRHFIGRITHSDLQRLFFRAMSENPSGITVPQFKQYVAERGEELSAHSMGGLQGSITKRIEHNYRNEDDRPFERPWTKERNSSGETVYRLKEQYLDWVQELVPPEEEMQGRISDYDR